MMNFATYDTNDNTIWGTGPTEAASISDARDWLGRNSDDAIDTLTTEPCSQALVDRVLSCGGQVQWQWSGTLSRYMDLAE